MELFMYSECEKSCSKLQTTIQSSHPKRQIVVYLTKDLEKNKSSVDCGVLPVSIKNRAKPANRTATVQRAEFHSHFVDYKHKKCIDHQQLINH